MDEQKIKEAAYALWEQDGKPDGLDLEHWFKASSALENDDSEGATDSNDEQAGQADETVNGESTHPQPKARMRNG